MDTRPIPATFAVASTAAPMVSHTSLVQSIVSHVPEATTQPAGLAPSGFALPEHTPAAATTPAPAPVAGASAAPPRESGFAAENPLSKNNKGWRPLGTFPPQQRESPYKGVTFSAEVGKWVCTLEVRPGLSVVMGRYGSEMLAALAYDNLAVLNGFPAANMCAGGIHERQPGAPAIPVLSDSAVNLLGFELKNQENGAASKAAARFPLSAKPQNCPPTKGITGAAVPIVGAKGACKKCWYGASRAQCQKLPTCKSCPKCDGGQRRKCIGRPTCTNKRKIRKGEKPRVVKPRTYSTAFPKYDNNTGKLIGMEIVCPWCDMGRKSYPCARLETCTSDVSKKFLKKNPSHVLGAAKVMAQASKAPPVPMMLKPLPMPVPGSSTPEAASTVSGNIAAAAAAAAAASMVTAPQKRRADGLPDINASVPVPSAAKKAKHIGPSNNIII